MLRLALAAACCLLLIACDAAAPDFADQPVGGPAAPVDEPGPKLSETIADGLVAWRKAGAIQGGASCASCHAPDAFDLAYFDFDDETIRRRVAPHLDEWDAQRIVALVGAIRVRDRITPRDHRTHRPFQPGGRVLAGATVAERDLAFGRQVVDAGLGVDPVLSSQAARRERDRWMASNPRTFPIGMALNRWSEDPHEGDASIADWLPDLPRVAHDAEAQRDLFAAHDAYLADPTDDALFELLDASDDLTTSGFDGNGGRFMKDKYGSVLVAQHLFREEVKTGSLWGDRPSSAWLPARMTRDKGPNPVWMVGDFARVHKKGDVELPAEVIARVGGGFDEEMRRVKLTWFWAGWQFDQGLQRTHGSNSTKSAEYMTDFLRKDFIDDKTPDGTTDRSGYALHNVYAITRKLIVENHDPILDAGRGHHRIGYANFHGYGLDIKSEPTDSDRQAIYRQIVANSYRMTLYLALDHLAENGVADIDRNHWPSPIGRMADFFEHIASPHLEHDRALIAQARAAIEE